MKVFAKWRIYLGSACNVRVLESMRGQWWKIYLMCQQESGMLHWASRGRALECRTVQALDALKHRRSRICCPGKPLTEDGGEQATCHSLLFGTTRCRENHVCAIIVPCPTHKCYWQCQRSCLGVKDESRAGGWSTLNNRANERRSIRVVWRRSACRF